MHESRNAKKTRTKAEREVSGELMGLLSRGKGSQITGLWYRFSQQRHKEENFALCDVQHIPFVVLPHHEILDHRHGVRSSQISRLSRPGDPCRIEAKNVAIHAHQASQAALHDSSCRGSTLRFDLCA